MSDKTFNPSKISGDIAKRIISAHLIGLVFVVLFSALATFFALPVMNGIYDGEPLSIAIFGVIQVIAIFITVVISLGGVSPLDILRNRDPLSWFFPLFVPSLFAVAMSYPISRVNDGDYLSLSLICSVFTFYFSYRMSSHFVATSFMSDRTRHNRMTERSYKLKTGRIWDKVTAVGSLMRPGMFFAVGIPTVLIIMGPTIGIFARSTVLYNVGFFLGSLIAVMIYALGGRLWDIRRRHKLQPEWYRPESQQNISHISIDDGQEQEAEDTL